MEWNAKDWNGMQRNEMELNGIIPSGMEGNVSPNANSTPYTAPDAPTVVQRFK